jgi:protein-tyrosine phosphatase
VTVDALAARGIRLAAPHRLPRDVCERDLTQARLIIALKESEHRPLFEARFAGFAGQAEYWTVDDVDCTSPAEALPILERHVSELLDRLSRI